MIAEYPPRNDKAWMGETAQSLYTHYFDGMNGNRCGFYMGPWVSTRGAITWDSVTCPDCLKLKKDHEPWTVQIDTRGG